MLNHARTLLMILWVTAGLSAQPQNAATSQGNDGKPAARDPFSTPQAKRQQPANLASSTLPDSTQLEPISTPKPIYPLDARERRLQGQVVIRLEISETGDVESATIVSGEPTLAEAAADAMKKWKFKPYIKGGKAVRVRVSMPHNFAFQGNVIMLKEPANPPAEQAPVAAAGDAAQTHPADSQHPEKLRVSQGVIDGSKIHDVAPVYPPEARRKHIQGEVQLRATIGKDGLIHNLEAISGPEELRQAAIGAVQQWRYRPYLLKGEPVEVSTIVTVRFHL